MNHRKRMSRNLGDLSSWRAKLVVMDRWRRPATAAAVSSLLLVTVLWVVGGGLGNLIGVGEPAPIEAEGHLGKGAVFTVRLPAGGHA